MSGEGCDLTRIADRWQETTAFTAIGPGPYLGSGRPDLTTDLPPTRGGIQSVDTAETWSILSLGGEADFHALDGYGDHWSDLDHDRLSGPDGGRERSGDRSGYRPASPSGSSLLRPKEPGVLLSTLVWTRPSWRVPCAWFIWTGQLRDFCSAVWAGNCCRGALHGHVAVVASGLKPRSRRLLLTTNTEENAIAAPASIGLRSPAAASGSAATL